MSGLRQTLAELRAIHTRSDWAKCKDPLLELYRIRYGDRAEWPQWLRNRYPDDLGDLGGRFPPRSPSPVPDANEGAP